MTQEEAIKAVDRIFNYCEEIDCHLPKEEQTGYDMLLDINAVIEYILDNPKVVRCKDCKYYKTVYESYYKQLPDYYPTEEDKHNGRCNHPDGLDGKIHEDNFCSKGERKETK